MRLPQGPMGTDITMTEQAPEQSPGQRFASALQQFEQSGNTDVMVSQYAESAELLRPEVDRTGSSGTDPVQFWEAYLAQFSEVSTEFTEITECDTHAALEWRSRGSLSTGRDISYAGVSLLTLDGGGKVRRFATYYDTAAFIEPTTERSTS